MKRSSGARAPLFCAFCGTVKRALSKPIQTGFRERILPCAAALLSRHFLWLPQHRPSRCKATPRGSARADQLRTELPKFQPADAERFIRPDVHAGDRPSGASFATRSPALGLSGAAGTAHPLATQTAIEMLKRGGSAVDAAVAANAVLGFVEPVSSGLGGDCFAFVWDPKVGKLMGMASSGQLAEGVDAGDSAGACRRRPSSGAGRSDGFHAGRARRMVDAAPALRQAQVGGTV